MRAGTHYELVARQLGHADVAMVAKVYGRFAPNSDERDRWEKIAAAQDAERETERARYQGLFQPNAGENEESRNPKTRNRATH